MLISLKLTNFRKVVSDEMTFTPGINAIRGANEASKSSRIEAIGYSLFGAKALRTPLEACVTWGEPVSSLKVTLTLSLGGDTFQFSRSKAGAEVLKNGAVFCTGQMECSALAATLLGADVNTAGKLLLANQNSIRGALDGGPKELSLLIEELSSMGVFDQILENAQEKLALGSPALLEERLKGAEATLEAAMQNLPPPVDAAQHDAAIKTLSDKVAATKESLPTLELAASAAEKAWRAASVLYMDRVTLESNVEKASENLKRAEDQVSALAPAASTLGTDSRPALRQELAEAEDFAARQVAYRVFNALPTGDRYNGPALEFESVSGLNAKEKGEVEHEVEVVTRQTIMAKAKRINHDKCDKCGQDVTHLKHVVETNAAVDAEIATLNRRETALRERLVTLSKDYTSFTGIERFAKLYTQAAAKISTYVTLDESTYPPTATWNGSVPQEGPDLADIKARLTKMDAEVKAVESAQAKYELAVEQLNAASAALNSAQQALATHQSPTADTILELTEAKDNASLNLNAAKGEIILAEREMAEVTTAFEAAQRLWSMAQSRVDDSTAVIAACKKDLGSLAFNNGLVKKLRAIRPVVANRVWASVLSATSVMFSQMRGEPSVVTKETSGFLVNGQSVASLSGSTLDLLGLALRVSMTRTFIPNSGLLVLDEPCAAMDSDRTEAMLGFIASAGYQQVLLITHEEISSSIADNLIEL